MGNGNIHIRDVYHRSSSITDKPHLRIVIATGQFLLYGNPGIGRVFCVGVAVRGGGRGWWCGVSVGDWWGSWLVGGSWGCRGSVRWAAGLVGCLVGLSRFGVGVAVGGVGCRWAAGLVGCLVGLSRFGVGVAVGGVGCRWEIGGRLVGDWWGWLVGRVFRAVGGGF